MQRKINIFLILLGIGLVLSGAGLLLVVNQLDPDQGIYNLIAFYSCLFVLSFTVSALAGFWLRRRFGIREFLQKHFAYSMRQGIWIGVLITASLVLQSQDLFSWINSVLLITALAFLEFYFQTNERNHPQT